MYYVPDSYYEPPCADDHYGSCDECEEYYKKIDTTQYLLEGLVNKLYQEETNLDDLKKYFKEFCDYVGCKCPETKILPSLNKQTQN